MFETPVQMRSLQSMQLAKHRGWRYDDTPDPHNADIAWKLFGKTPGGLAWRLAFDTNFSDTGTPPAYQWRCQVLPEERAPRFLFAVPGRYKVGIPVKPPGFGAAIAKLLFGPDLSGNSEEYRAQQRFLAGAIELPADGTRFVGHFQLVVPDLAWGRSVFPRTVLQDLVEWPAGTVPIPREQVGLHTFDGLVVLVVQHDVFHAELCERIVALGSTIADNIVAADSGRSRSPAQ